MTTAKPISLMAWAPFKAAATRVLDPIDPALHDKVGDAQAPGKPPAWIVSLCLCASIALLFIIAGHGAGRRGEPHVALPLFWCGVVLMLLPIGVRVALPVLARAERLILLVVLTEYMFLYKFLYAPTAFVQFDEMLHWITAHDVLYRRELFLENTLLPISPFYPALEILTTALSNLANVAVFPAATVVIAVLRQHSSLASFCSSKNYLTRAHRSRRVSDRQSCSNIRTF